MNRFWRILLWVLFWYYLAPYYLFKKFVFKNKKHKIAWSALGSVITVFVLFCCWVNSLPDDEETTSNTASAPKTHVVVKKVGVQRLAKDQAKEKVLNTEEKKKQKEDDKLVAEIDAAKKAQQEAKKHSKRPKSTAASKRPLRITDRLLQRTTLHPAMEQEEEIWILPILVKSLGIKTQRFTTFQDRLAIE